MSHRGGGRVRVSGGGGISTFGLGNSFGVGGTGRGTSMIWIGWNTFRITSGPFASTRAASAAPWISTTAVSALLLGLWAGERIAAVMASSPWSSLRLYERLSHNMMLQRITTLEKRLCSERARRPP